MNKTQWKNRIKKSCEGVGMYRKEFDDIISTLADILEQRDSCKEQFEKLGAKPIISHTNKGGATNLVKNPMLVLWQDLNTQALAYWRDLGLTPKGLKSIDEEAMKPKKQSGLAEVLANIEKDIS